MENQFDPQKVVCNVDLFDTIHVNLLESLSHFFGSYLRIKQIIYNNLYLIRRRFIISLTIENTLEYKKTKQSDEKSKTHRLEQQNKM